MPATAPMTELKLRTDFILDRMKFLDTVCDAVMYEDQPEKRAVLDLLLKNEYPSIIGRVVAGAVNADERDQALWTLAVLLGSDSEDVRAAANEACQGVRDTIFQALKEPGNAEMQRSAAYLLFNWLKRFGTNEEDEQVLRLVDSGFVRGVANGKIRADLLWAIAAALTRTRAGHKAAREVVDLLREAGKREFAPLLEAFVEICSEDEKGQTAFATADHQAVFDLFEHLLIGANLSVEDRFKVLWALSNFVCEPEAADQFFGRSALRAEIQGFCEDNHAGIRMEAAWVLCNAVARTTDAIVEEEIGSDYGLRYALCAVEADLAKKGRLYKSIHETLDRLSHLEVLYTPLECDCGCEDEETVEAEAETEVNYPCERPSAAEFNLPVATTEAPLPSALELLVAPANRNGSATLRGLVYSLKNAGATGWVPVPAGTMLTIEDLTLMSSLGYTIASGYFGVNPYIRAGF